MNRVNRGGGCYHETKWLPETAELGRRFFTGIGFRGMGNIEFKRDTLCWNNPVLDQKEFVKLREQLGFEE